PGTQWLAGPRAEGIFVISAGVSGRRHSVGGRCQVRVIRRSLSCSSSLWMLGFIPWKSMLRRVRLRWHMNHRVMAVECCKTSPLKRQRGFVMLAVMWVLLATLAGVSLFAHWVHRSLDHAQTRQDSLNAQIAARSAMNTALFIRLTGQRFAYGTTVPDLAATDEDVL